MSSPPAEGAGPLHRQLEVIELPPVASAVVSLSGDHRRRDHRDENRQAKERRRRRRRSHRWRDSDGENRARQIRIMHRVLNTEREAGIGKGGVVNSFAIDGNGQNTELGATSGGATRGLKVSEMSGLAFTRRGLESRGRLLSLCYGPTYAGPREDGLGPARQNQLGGSGPARFVT